MSIKSISAIRRAELSRAAFEVVATYGLRMTTLEKVADIAGVSKGVVLHHFKDKGLLLEAVFRKSNSILNEAVMELYKYANNPYERLWAIVIANFYDTIFNHKMCQAWVSLAAEVPFNIQCQRVQTACHSRIHTNLKHELKSFLNVQQTEKAAKHLGVLIDGIWLRAGLNSKPTKSDEAIDEIEYSIQQLILTTDSRMKHQRARAKIQNVASILMSSRAFKEKAL